ncbi:S53 family peptidase [Streptomyces pinistramenti]|uniref:S53 family peptidase n=1 Tax=Streptomyces pinistramenti TaxID=2884812 RepID=UPI001D06E89D|nr:S53 family peptidase [Streptomyces pinistramenti]MCB5906766.1 S53 family peptidase [Streptomyces pinistramenti]
MRSSRTRALRARAGLAWAATLPLVAGALALGAPAADAAGHDGGRHAFQGTKPAWATQQADQGATAGSTDVTARVYLAGRDAKGLAAYARAVSDPHSASYGKYLSPDQVKARYGATQDQITKVTDWLKTSGLKITGTGSRYLTVKGDASAAERAFATDLHNYRKDGHTYHAPSATASAPGALSDAVLTVTGLDNAPRLARHHSTELPPPSNVYRNAGPFSSYYGSKTDKHLPSAYGAKASYAVKGYTGKELRAAYGAKKWTGKGVTVAITDAYASPTIAADAQKYASRNGDPRYRRGQLSQVLPKDYSHIEDCGAAGWYGEETLDVEALHAVAPDSDVVYVGAASCNDDDLLDSLGKIVDGHLADIVSNSWGDIEANETPDVAAAYDQLFQQGAVQGIGFYFSSGDNGDEVANTGTKQVDTPANSAWVTAVGGTALAVGKNGTYQWETGWGTQKAVLSKDGSDWTGFPGEFNGGAGGGTSKTIAQPFYQRGVVPDGLAKANGGGAMRTVPDIAAVADPNTGFLVGQTQTLPGGKLGYDEYRIGGTSLAAPVIAGVQALAQQARHGVPIGFANPGIYQRYGTPAYHDVTDHPLGAGRDLAVIRVDYVNGIDGAKGTTTTLRSLGKDSSLHAGVGYDDVTGVGSPGADYVSSYRP